MHSTRGHIVNRSANYRQQGVSLIEVLVSTVIIAIALLGLMSLQITSLKTNQSAYARSQANFLAYDILESMRVNSPASQYFNAGSVNGSCVAFNQADATPNCTASQMSEDDTFRWRQKIARELTQGDGLVCRSDLVGDVAGTPDCEADNSDFPVVVYIWWADNRNGDLLQISLSGEV